MITKKSPDFLEIFKRVVQKHEGSIKNEDLEDAINNMLYKSNIKNFNEYIRSYAFRNIRQTHANLYENIKYLVYQYSHCGDLLGHYGLIERIAFDNSNKQFFSAGSDGLIKCWNKDTGYLVNCLLGHRGMINDLCFSKDGKLMVSCDFYGVINIWCLSTFRLLFNIQEAIGIVFSEFYEKDEFYNLIIILSNGIVKFYKFSISGVIDCKENIFTIDEAYKAICITDGGRFLLRAGYWAYLIILDTHNPDKCLVFETNNTPVKTICAGKDCLRFAAGCNNLLFIWTFFCEGSSSYGNFSKVSKNVQGYWKKTVVKMEENYTIENICFLKNHFIVCVCSDLKIRIFAESVIRYTFDIDEICNVCPHPTENIFALCGQTLKFYYFEKLIQAIKLDFLITDYQFSSNGDTFIIGDEIGTIKVFSLDNLHYKIKEQFFMSDFAHLNDTFIDLYQPSDRNSLVNKSREFITDWVIMPYKIEQLDNRKNCFLENLGMCHFTTKFIDKAKFKRKYCATCPEDPANSLENLSSSEDSSVYTEESSTIETPTNESSSYSSDKDVIIRRKDYFKRKETSTEMTEEIHRGVRLRRYNNNDDEGIEYSHYRRNKRTKKSNKESEENEKRTESPTRVRLRRHQL